MSGRTKWRLGRVMLIGAAVGLALGLVQLFTGSAELASTGNRAEAAGQRFGFPLGAALAMALLFGAIGLIRNFFVR